MSSLLYAAFKASLIATCIASVLIPCIVLSNLIHRLFSDASLPGNLPWAGTAEHSALARAKANLTSVFSLRSLLDEGYGKYSKNNLTYVLPYFLNGPQVILPMSQVRWLLEQPNSTLSQEHVNRQFLEAEYTFMHANLVDGPVHPEIIAHQLTKRISTFADDIVDEMRASLEDNWGTDTEEWREVKVYDTMLDVISRLSVRVLMGLPLCRNRDFLQACSSFIRNVVLAAAAISLFPEFLKPVFAPIFTLYDYVQYQRCNRFMMPIIYERLAQLQPKEKPPVDDSKPPNDYVQWAIDHALAKPIINPMELDPRVISSRFSILVFAAIQSSVITLTNTIFDLASALECGRHLSIMREEVIQETSASHPPRPSTSTWSKSTLARMTHIDSALRESLRLNGFIERGIMKMVVAPEGVTLPDGSHLRHGTKVGVSGYSVHHDGDIYENAMKYDAFRFARSREDGERPQALVTTSEKFMGFSHGAHACPGRFFAANQLKIALAHIVLLYEIEPISKRPANPWFFGHIGPPIYDTLRVRRRRP